MQNIKGQDVDSFPPHAYLLWRGGLGVVCLVGVVCGILGLADLFSSGGSGGQGFALELPHALSFVLLSASILIQAKGLWPNIFRHIALFAVMGMAAISLFQFFSGIHYGFDHFQIAGKETTFLKLILDGPSSLFSSSILLLLAISGALQINQRKVLCAQAIALIVAVISFLPLVHYFYSHLLGFGKGVFILMPGLVCLLSLVASLAVFFKNPELGLSGFVVKKTLGGWVLKRLLPFVIGTPVLIGALQLYGESSQLLDSSFRISVIMVALVVIWGAALWRASLQLNRIDEARNIAEARLEEQEKNYHDQFMNSSVSMLMIDPASTLIVEANKAAAAFYGYSREELLTMSICDINTLPREECLHVMATVKEGKGGRFEFRHRLGDGSVRDVAAYTSRVLFGGHYVNHSIIIDITDKKRAEIELRQSEERFRLLTENNVSAVASHRLVVNEDGLPVDYTFLTANPAFEKHTGLKVRDVIGRRVTEVLPGIETDPFIRYYGHVVSTGEPISFEQFSKPLGRHYCVNAYRLDEDKFAAVFSDITERKKSEEELKDREAFLETLIETVPIPVFYKNRDGRYVLVNKAFETLFWKDKDFLIGRTVFDVLPRKLAEISNAKDQDLFTHPGVQAYYSQVVDGMGVVHDVIFQKATVYDQSGGVKGLIGAILNITDQKRLEEELRETQQRLQEVEGQKLVPLV